MKLSRPGAEIGFISLNDIICSSDIIFDATDKDKVAKPTLNLVGRNLCGSLFYGNHV